MIIIIIIVIIIIVVFKTYKRNICSMTRVVLHSHLPVSQVLAVSFFPNPSATISRSEIEIGEAPL